MTILLSAILACHRRPFIRSGMIYHRQKHSPHGRVSRMESVDRAQFARSVYGAAALTPCAVLVRLPMAHKYLNEIHRGQCEIFPRKTWQKHGRMRKDDCAILGAQTWQSYGKIISYDQFHIYDILLPRHVMNIQFFS